MPWKLLPIALAAGLVAGCGSTDPAPRTSSCGPVDLPAAALGVERTRALTACLLNEERARQNVGPLRYDARLELASQRHSDDMVRRRFFEHDTPDGVAPYARMAAAGYPATNAFTGENIAWGEGGKSSPAEVVESWMRSPPHREAILHPQYGEVGVGVTLAAPRGGQGSSATYTTDFGGPPIR